MGDIPTHARITEFVVRQLQLVFPPASIPPNDYTFLELGNFLTDVSQFRDPPAFHRAREVARQQARSEAGGIGVAAANEWVNGMFGQASGGTFRQRLPPGPRHGWLPEFLRRLMYAFTHQVFDTDGLPTLGPPLGVGPGGGGVVPPMGIDPKTVDEVLDNSFTQYFPHEHLDLPPMQDEPRHRRLTEFQAQRSGLIGYLELDLQYLSEGLSKLEHAWVRARAEGMNERQRRGFLLRLGHLLHAVEDHFFHSNATELRQWQFLQRSLRRFDPATPEGRAAIFEQGLLGTSLDQRSVHLRRLLQRRLRYPVFDEKGFSQTASEDGTTMLFTGGFGENDVWHTLGGALETIEPTIRRIISLRGSPGMPGPVPGPLATFPDPRNSHLVLVRLLFNEEARRNMVRDNSVEKLRDQHAKQLTDGAYPPEIEQMRSRGQLSVQAAARLTEAFTFDREFEELFTFFPGPGGVLITLLDRMQRERDANDQAVRKLDSNARSIMGEGSANSASAENIGTHSLMSKDSSDKEPLRPDALALAMHASAGVATVLARRLESNAPANQGVDWDAVVRFFIRFPSPRSRWEEELLRRLRRDGAGFRQPDVRTLADQPRFPLLGPGRGAERLRANREGNARQKLEAEYTKFESNPR